MTNKTKRDKARIKKEACRKARKRKVSRSAPPELWSEPWFGKRAFLYIDDPEDKSDIGKRPDFIWLFPDETFALAEYKDRISVFAPNWFENVAATASEQFDSMRGQPNLLNVPQETPSVLILRFRVGPPRLVAQINRSMNSEDNHKSIDMVCCLFPSEKSWLNRVVCIIRTFDSRAAMLARKFLDIFYIWNTGNRLPGEIVISPRPGLDVSIARIFIK